MRRNAPNDCIGRKMWYEQMSPLDLFSPALDRYTAPYANFVPVVTDGSLSHKTGLLSGLGR